MSQNRTENGTHLPECPQASTTPIRDLLHDVCICRALRACERRVITDALRPAAPAIRASLDALADALNSAKADGYPAGVQAAREAVAAAVQDRIDDLANCSKDDACMIKADGAVLALDAAVAAIDALTANADTTPDDGARRQSCTHTKYEGCPPCAHSAEGQP